MEPQSKQQQWRQMIRLRMLSLPSHNNKLYSRCYCRICCWAESVAGFGQDLYRCWVIIIRHVWRYWGSFTGLAEMESLTLPDKFRLTTGSDQAFDPIVRVGKSAVNQPDNPLAYYQPYSIYVLHSFWLPLSLSFHTAPIFFFCSSDVK